MAWYKNAKTENADKDGTHSNALWVWRGILVCFLCAVIFSMLYGMFRAKVAEQLELHLETEANAGWLYQNTFLLYRDLYNRQGRVQKDYREIYLEPDAGYEWIMDEGLLERYAENEEAYEDSAGGEDRQRVQEGDLDYLSAELAMFDSVFQGLEGDFGLLNSLYNYRIQDNGTGYYITNMTEEELEKQGQDDVFRVSYVFDSAGNASVEDILFQNGDVTLLRRTAAQALKNTQRFDTAMLSYDRYGTIRGPRDCTVTYSVTAEKWNQNIRQQYGFRTYEIFGEFGYYTGHGDELKCYGVMRHDSSTGYWSYLDVGVGGYLTLFWAAVLLMGCFLPILGKTAPWRGRGVCGRCPEFLIIAGFLMLLAAAPMVYMVAGVASGQAVENLGGWHRFVSPVFDTVLVWTGNFLLLTIYFFSAWYLGVCARAVRETGIKTYVKQRSMIYRFFPLAKRKFAELFDFFLHVDLTGKTNGIILKIVAVNALILFVISSLWLGGLAVVIPYSAALYVVLRKYVNALQKRYQILLKAVDEMAEGNLNVSIEEDLGIFEPFKLQMIKIQEGFKKAVDEEVKSQRMKAELITNVSHDLKTPLTAIITYVNLLKDPGLTEEQRREYLDTLERKSLRLKVLIEDLFEVSKANSGNITLNLMAVDIVNLIRQVHFEMKDKLDEAGLDVRMSLPDEKIILSLDSQKTYRIYENLLGNVAKYALRGTRVYVNGFEINDTVVITIKNISAKELTVDASELSERFVRGDIARNTEGSGLGLAIAKSFTELQGGVLELEVDGDLFKATTVFPRQGGRA